MKNFIVTLLILFASISTLEAFAENSKTLSQNDRKFYEKIQQDFGPSFVNSVDRSLEEYTDRMNMFRWSEAKKVESHGQIIMKVETMIQELLMKYPQDSKLPKEVNQRYLVLTYLKFELIMLDFSDSAQKESELRERLTSVQYEVTQNSATEKPFTNAYVDNFEEGIYVDIVDGTVLFSSTDKYKTNTGWPAFTGPVSTDAIDEFEDLRYNMQRLEVKSRLSGSHLGHIFTDGPQETGGLRYCINSASLEFIPKAELEFRGYGDYLSLFE